MTDDDQQQCYVLQESELVDMNNWWLHIFTEIAFYTKWHGALRPKNASPPRSLSLSRKNSLARSLFSSRNPPPVERSETTETIISPFVLDPSDSVKAPNSRRNNESDSVTMPTSFMTGSIVGKRFYKKVTTRYGNGWTVMLDYRTLKTPSKRPFKLCSLALAKAIAAEWEYQAMSIVLSGIHPHQNLAVVVRTRDY